MAGEDTLHRFYLVTAALRSAMQVDMPLDGSEQLRFENHMALLHMTYVEWKRRNLRLQRDIVWNPSIDKTMTHARRLA